MTPPWTWNLFKRLGISITARFGGAAEKEKRAFHEKWDKKCSRCHIYRWDHASQDHNFVEPKGV